MIHSSIILAIPCTINLTPKQGLINPTPTYRSIQNHERRLGSKHTTLVLDLDLDLETRIEKVEIWSAPPLHGAGERERERERATARRERG